jgi:hypothetical protein
MTKNFKNTSRSAGVERYVLFVLLSAFALLIGVLIWGHYEFSYGFYPDPQKMPPVISETTEQLLKQFEEVLADKAPAVLQSLQPGLSQEQIAELGKKGKFTLSADLRKLYQWRNGTKDKDSFLILGFRFIPLEEMAVRSIYLENYSIDSFVKKLLLRYFFKSYTKNLVQIFYDRSGNSYFYDSYANDASRAFFCQSNTNMCYIFFPSFRNFLKGAIECYQKDIFVVKDSGSTLYYNTVEAHKIWNRLGCESPENNNPAFHRPR